MMKGRVQGWVLAARPKTLTAAVVPVLAATALVAAQGLEVQWEIAALCALAAVCIQIATNFINDALDADKGADTAERIGPRRALHQGLLSRSSMMRGAGVCLFLAFLAGLPLALQGGWPIVLVGVVSIFMAYSYTGGPFPLAYLGLGDIFVVLFFGLIAVGGVYFLQTGSLSAESLVLGLQIGFLATVLIAINNLRDVYQDRQAGKKTLAVRFGIAFVRAEIAFLVAAPFLLQIFWYQRDAHRLFAAGLPLILLPLALSIVRSVARTEPSAAYNGFLARSALLHSGFGVLMAVGFFIDAAR